MMDLPFSLQSVGGIAVLAILLGLFWWVSQRRQRGAYVRKMPEIGLAYEWVATPLARAKKDLVRRFPELDDVLAGRPDEGVNLIRFGLFNMTEAPLPAEQIRQPVEIVFPDGADILSARYGEALKVDPELDAAPEVVDSRVVLPTFAMTPRSTVIFNVIVRGDATPTDVLGETETHGTIRRVS